MICDGSLAIDVMGFLKHMEQQTKHSIIWTAGGAASLIVFLKCLGFTYDQIIENLLKLDCLTSLVFGVQTQTPLYLNYNDIFTYHIAATKELTTQLNAEKEKTAILETQVEEEKAKTATLETQMADLLARVTALENPYSYHCG